MKIFENPADKKIICVATEQETLILWMDCLRKEIERRYNKTLPESSKMNARVSTRDIENICSAGESLCVLTFENEDFFTVQADLN